GLAITDSRKAISMPDLVRPEDLPRGKRRRQAKAPPAVVTPGDLDPTPAPAPLAQPADAPQRRAARSRRPPAAPQAAPPPTPTVPAIPATPGDLAADIPEAPALTVAEAPALQIPDGAGEIRATTPVATVVETSTAP